MEHPPNTNTSLSKSLAKSNFVDSRLLPKQYQDLTTTEGLRKSFHGNLFQVSILVLAAIRATKNANVKNTHLISEAPQFEKFDDLVIDYGDRITFLQAKHGSEEAKKDEYNKSDFASADDDVSLAKYFDSWYSLKNGSYIKKENGEIKKAHYILFTNKGVTAEVSNYLIPYKIENDDFLFENLPCNTYIFDPRKISTDLIDAIKVGSKIVQKKKKSKKYIITLVSKNCLKH